MKASRKQLETDKIIAELIEIFHQDNKKFTSLALEIGTLVDEKNEAYGDSFSKVADFLEILYPNGIPVEAYTDALCIVRIFDKLMRLATDKSYNNERPYADIAGYAFLGLQKDREKRYHIEDDLLRAKPANPEKYYEELKTSKPTNPEKDYKDYKEERGSKIIYSEGKSYLSSERQSQYPLEDKLDVREARDDFESYGYEKAYAKVSYADEPDEPIKEAMPAEYSQYDKKLARPIRSAVYRREYDRSRLR